MAARGVILAAPASGSGKTVLTLGLLRALSRQYPRIGAFKVGPDYIDPAFHAAATGRPSFNIDLWAMRPATVAQILRRLDDDSDLIVGEGVMGLFDGAADNSGSTADVAALTGLPVVLVVDVRGQAASVAALLRGFMGHRADVPISGVIFNRVGGPAHEAMLRQAVAPLGLPVLGAVPRDAALVLPDRHLGLVQAAEHERLEEFVDRAAQRLEATVDLQRLADLARPLQVADAGTGLATPPLGQRIAIARDTAFSFAYPAVLEGWQRQGADLSFFSPLADEPPAEDADAVYLPGGYPELHGGRLAAAEPVQGWTAPGGHTRRGGLWRMRRLHGDGRIAGGCRWPAPRHGWSLAGGHQLRRAPAPSGIPSGRLAAGHGNRQSRPEVPRP